jgi:hypothetical protein
VVDEVISLRRLTDVGDMETFVEQVYSVVPGMVQKEECVWLYEMAKRCSRGVVVEIGSSAGLSTICLGGGSKAGNKVKVYAIDPFNGGGATPDPTWYDMSDEGTPDRRYYVNQGVSFQPFWENVKKFNLEEIIHPIVDYSELAVKRYPGDPIELLFIDGDHRYNYVKLDVELWTPFMISNGVIALHDCTYVGVERVIKEIISNPARFKNLSYRPIFHAIKV